MTSNKSKRTRDKIIQQDLESRALEIAESKIKHKKQVLDKTRRRSIELFSEKQELKKDYQDALELNHRIELQKKEIETKNGRLKRAIAKSKKRTIDLFGKHIDLKKAKKRIDFQNKLIEDKNKELEAKNNALNDSLAYAKLIQQSILPTTNFIASKFYDSFVFFSPKEMVSGDFYWYSEQKHFKYLALVDCTGHGVPGALMSMIGNSLLNKIVDNKLSITPSEILTQLNKEVTCALQQSSDTKVSQTDGMDITLCQINTLINEVTIASAIQNYFVVDDDKVKFFKGDNFSVGGVLSDHPDLHFTDYKIKANKELKVYMYTDGYTDQFGGIEGRKFMRCNLKKLISENHSLPMSKQKDIFSRVFEDWKREYKQIDDVSLIGFSVKQRAKKRLK